MKHRSAGFTIVEIAVVVAIISVLTTITLVVFNQTQQSSRDDRRTADITSIKRALISYYNDNGEYPTCTNAGMGCQLSAISSSIQRYLPTVPLTDPKGTAYLYAPGVVPNQYGLFVGYENSQQCKTGINMDASWWYSVADCASIYPNRF